MHSKDATEIQEDVTHHSLMAVLDVCHICDIGLCGLWRQSSYHCTHQFAKGKLSQNNCADFIHLRGVLFVSSHFGSSLGIIEPLFVKGSGKNSTLSKIGKNVFRTVAVVACGAVAVGARKELDRFVAVIGAVCCMPLAIIYPSLIHYSVIKGNAIIDLSCAFLGIALMLFTLYRSIQQW